MGVVSGGCQTRGRRCSCAVFCDVTWAWFQAVDVTWAWFQAVATHEGDEAAALLELQRARLTDPRESVWATGTASWWADYMTFDPVLRNKDEDSEVMSSSHRQRVGTC